MDSVPSCRCSHQGQTESASTLAPVLSGEFFHSPEGEKELEGEGWKVGEWKGEEGGGGEEGKEKSRMNVKV